MGRNQSGTVRPEKLEFDEALQEALTKLVQGEIFDELGSRRISTRKTKCKRQN